MSDYVLILQVGILLLGPALSVAVASICHRRLNGYTMKYSQIPNNYNRKPTNLIDIMRFERTSLKYLSLEYSNKPLVDGEKPLFQWTKSVINDYHGFSLLREIPYTYGGHFSPVYGLSLIVLGISLIQIQASLAPLKDLNHYIFFNNIFLISGTAFVFLSPLISFNLMYQKHLVLMKQSHYRLTLLSQHLLKKGYINRRSTLVKVKNARSQYILSCIYYVITAIILFIIALFPILISKNIILLGLFHAHH